MPAQLTEEEFSKHVNTKFRVTGNPSIELELDEVKGYRAGPNDQGGMERFSAFFRGPSEPQLLQMVHALAHDRMGAFELFLVPIAKDEKGFRYEAVFNYFKEE